jgi:hypothetical protein
LTIAITVLLVAACANVPKEVVELSYVVGQDLSVVHQSHKTLIHQHFESLRAQRIEYLEKVWTPAFVSAWVNDGHLVNIATGKEAYSEAKGTFVSPSPGREKVELLDSVHMWASAAIEQIEKKRSTLLAPLAADEKELTAAVDEAFARLIRGNATITAHLNSLRKVQEVQDDFLKALDLKDLRQKIHEGLANASDKAQRGLEAMQRADGALINVGGKLKDAAEKLRR